MIRMIEKVRNKLKSLGEKAVGDNCTAYEKRHYFDQEAYEKQNFFDSDKYIERLMREHKEEVLVEQERINAKENLG